ncbi:MAG: CAP domain-containing protein [Paracoccus sp. (in: a-proteobacteria)]
MTYATAEERYLLTLINASRAQHGQDRLYLERHLNLAADRHTDWMLETDTFSHSGVQGSRSSDRIRSAGFDLSNGWSTAENIAYVSIDNDGTLTDEIEQLHRNLMNSPSHRATLLSGEYDLVGLGLKVGSFVQGGRSYTVLMLTENFAATGGHVEYDLAPGISFHTIDRPDWAVTTPDRIGWLSEFDGRINRYTAESSAPAGTDRIDDIRLGAAADRVNGLGGHDWIAGGGGNDRLKGGSGNDRLLGQNGADTLLGEEGSDIVSGGGGDDRLIGGDGQDHLHGGSGHDQIIGQVGKDRLAGGGGNDQLRGNSGTDRLDGGAGHDRLYGGSEADTLVGGTGNDTLYGEAGSDSFVFQGVTGRDRVMDYQPRADRILIDDALIDGDLEDFVRNDIRKVAAGVRIELDDDQVILVVGDLTVQQVADGIFLI